MYSPATTIQIINFIRSIGINVDFSVIENETFLPGLAIDKGGIVIDSEKLKHPGDLLHLAGHIALTSSDKRALLNDYPDKASEKGGDEIAAMAWVYAAGKHLGMDSKIIFHEDNYRVSSAVLADAFSKGGNIGVPMLQWCGMTYDDKQAVDLQVEPYPHMVNWLSQQ